MEQVRVCLVLSRCRTGSTTLLKSLAAADGVASYLEILNGAQAHSYQRYVIDACRADGEAARQFVQAGPLSLLEAYLEHLKKEAARSCELRILFIECKIENLWVFGAPWAHPALELHAIGALHRLNEVSDTVFLLHRRNVLSRFCSNRVAKATGVFHAAQGDQRAAVGQTGFVGDPVDPDFVVRNFVQELEFDKRIEDWFRKRGKGATKIAYEDVFDGDDFHLSFRKLVNEASGEAIDLPKPVMSRVRSVVDRDVLPNYDELVRVIRATPRLKDVARAIEKDEAELSAAHP